MKNNHLQDLKNAMQFTMRMMAIAAKEDDSIMSDPTEAMNAVVDEDHEKHSFMVAMAAGSIAMAVNIYQCYKAGLLPLNSLFHDKEVDEEEAKSGGLSETIKKIEKEKGVKVTKVTEIEDDQADQVFNAINLCNKFAKKHGGFSPNQFIERIRSDDEATRKEAEWLMLNAIAAIGAIANSMSGDKKETHEYFQTGSGYSKMPSVDDPASN